MLQLDGKTLRYDKAFVHDGVQYPSNWLRLTSLEEKQAIGIVEVPDAPVASWDQRFYWGVDNPKDLDQLKDIIEDGIHLPYADGRARAWLFEQGVVERETHGEDGSLFHLRWNAKQKAQFEKSFGITNSAV